MSENKTTSVPRNRVPKRLVGGAALVALAMLAGPFVMRENELAMGLFGVVVALATTLLSLWGSKWYAEASARDELTRYGLQAWRNLDSLQIKVSQQVGDVDLDDRVLAGWLLDIDQAKWAWKDLLQEVFTLQARLEKETSEVASRYRAQIEAAQTPEAKGELESKLAAELASIASKAPMPLRIPVDVVCPNCRAQVTASLGQSTGDTAWPVCGACQRRFPVHRQADGGIEIGGSPSKTELEVKCPGCQGDISLSVPRDRSIAFVTVCPACRTHVQFKGSAESHQLNDLQVTNSDFSCAECGGSYRGWVAPDRLVTFLTTCELCHKTIRVASDGSSVTTSKVTTTA